MYMHTHTHTVTIPVPICQRCAGAGKRIFFLIHEVITWEKRKKSPANILLTHTVTIPVPIGQRCAGGDLARRQIF